MVENCFQNKYFIINVKGEIQAWNKATAVVSATLAHLKIDMRRRQNSRARIRPPPTQGRDSFIKPSNRLSTTISNRAQR